MTKEEKESLQTILFSAFETGKGSVFTKRKFDDWYRENGIEESINKLFSEQIKEVSDEEIIKKACEIAGLSEDGTRTNKDKYNAAIDMSKWLKSKLSNTTSQLNAQNDPKRTD